MIKNSLKIVILGIIGFALLVYFTAPKNPNNNEVKVEKSVLILIFYQNIMKLLEVILFPNLKCFSKKVLKNIWWF